MSVNALSRTFALMLVVSNPGNSTVTGRSPAGTLLIVNGVIPAGLPSTRTDAPAGAVLIRMPPGAVVFGSATVAIGAADAVGAIFGRSRVVSGHKNHPAITGTTMATAYHWLKLSRRMLVRCSARRW